MEEEEQAHSKPHIDTHSSGEEGEQAHRALHDSLTDALLAAVPYLISSISAGDKFSLFSQFIPNF